MSGLVWYNAQLHNHSTNSDGKDSVPEMVEKLSARGAQMLALTDHNTAAGNEEFLRVCKEKGVIGIRGNEVSTYFGHVVGLMLEEYVDWRYYVPSNPEAIFDDLHARGALCGYAHPIRIGYPLVPSCCWLYEIHDYSKIDYYEILNTGDYSRSRNDMIIEEWIGKLREGFLHLGATSGLDYHARPYHGHEYVTYVGLYDGGGDDPERAAVDAIRGQRMIVCKDKLIEFTLEDEAGNVYVPGDTVPCGPVRLKIAPSESAAFPARPVVVVDDQNGSRTFHTAEGIYMQPDTFAVVRLYDGSFDFDHLIAVTNPFHMAR